MIQIEQTPNPDSLKLYALLNQLKQENDPISIQYKDPKGFDGTPQETKKYDERSIQIASEFFYVFNKVAEKKKVILINL